MSKSASKLRRPASPSPALLDASSAARARRAIQRDSARANELRDHAFRRVILSVPQGKVSTYGKVAAAAGYPLYHRAVARLLRTEPSHLLPWQRIVGAGGRIKLPEPGHSRQRALLKSEGVTWLGDHIDMDRHEHALSPWEELL